MNLSNWRKWDRRILFLSVCIIPFILTGCWSAREINDMAIINAMSVDLNDLGEYEVTTVIAKPSAIFTQPFGGGGNPENKYLIKTTAGKTIFDAIHKLSSSIPEKIYFGHMEVVIFGEKLAKEKMESAIDFFIRENELRPNIQLLIAKGKAVDILNISPNFNSTIGIEIMDLTRMNQFYNTKMVKDLRKFMESYSSNTSDPVTGVLTTAENVGITVTGEDLESQNGQKRKPQVISLDGTVVFKNGKLKGFLNNQETRGLHWIRGEIRNDDIVVLDCDKDIGNISIIVRENKSEFIPNLNGFKPKMTIKLFVEADVGEITCSSLSLDSIELDEIAKKLEKKIKEDATLVLDKVQKQWQSDIFGFGEAIYRSEPQQWDKMAPTWRKSGLKELDVEIKVNANISRFGLLKEPMKPYESR